MPLIGCLRGRPGKISYGFGNLGHALIFHSIGLFLIYFYVVEVRLDPALVGLGFFASYGVWNSINDPIAGYISDRTKTRLGRRIPFILLFTPLMILFFILIWSPPVGGAPLPTPFNIWIFLYFIVIVGIFELTYTFIAIGWGALFPEMFQDLDERTEVSLYRQVAAMIGSIIGFILTPLIIASLTDRFGTFSGWTLTGAILCCISGGVFLVSLLGSRERREFSMAGTLPIKTAFKVTFTNRSFLTAASCVLMISWIWSLLSAMSPFLVVFMLGGTLADVAIVSSPIFFMGILFYPLWRKICIRYGTKKTLTIATFLSVLFILPVLLVADTILKAFLIMLFYGFANSGVTLLRELLIPDVIDEDQIKTGFRREGIYYGVGAFIDRFSLALTGISTTLIFSLTGFDPAIPQQPPHVILGMRLATTMVLIVALLGFLVSMKYYPLGAERVVQIRRILEKLNREEAEQKLVAERREG